MQRAGTALPVGAGLQRHRRRHRRRRCQGGALLSWTPALLPTSLTTLWFTLCTPARHAPSWLLDCSRQVCPATRQASRPLAALARALPAACQRPRAALSHGVRCRSCAPESQRDAPGCARLRGRGCPAAAAAHTTILMSEEHLRATMTPRSRTRHSLAHKAQPRTSNLARRTITDRRAAHRDRKKEQSRTGTSRNARHPAASPASWAEHCVRRSHTGRPERLRTLAFTPSFIRRASFFHCT